VQGHGGKIANGSECSRRGESSRCLLGVEGEAEKGNGRLCLREKTKWRLKESRVEPSPSSIY